MTLTAQQRELIQRGWYAALLARALAETDDLALATEAADLAFAEQPEPPDEEKPKMGSVGGAAVDTAGTGGGTFNQPGDFAPEPKPPKSTSKKIKGGKGRGRRRLPRGMRLRKKWKHLLDDAAFGMVKGFWHGPKPPSPEWVLVKTGARGGKIWAPSRGATQPHKPARQDGRSKELAGQLADLLRGDKQQEAVSLWNRAPVSERVAAANSLGDKLRNQLLIAAMPRQQKTGAVQQSPKSWTPESIAQNPSLRHWGESLEISDIDREQTQRHISDLALLPGHLVTVLKDNGLRSVALGDKPSTELDNNGHLRGVAPRGWDNGQTWDSVPGLYNNSHKTVTAGAGDHGSISLALHETGHAVGGLLAFDNNPVLIEHHKRLYDKLSPYLQQGGEGGFAGRQELFAEGFAAVIKNREYARRIYDDAFVEWIEKAVLGKENDSTVG